MYLRKGDLLEVTATGRVSLDEGCSWQTPDGTFVEVRGHASPPGNINLQENTLLLKKAKVGVLLGWIGNYSLDRTIELGSKHAGIVDHTGKLYLAVNDIRGRFDDNTSDSKEPTYFTAKVRITRREAVQQSHVQNQPTDTTMRWG